MQRTIQYRGCEIHVDLVRTSADMFDASFRVECAVSPKQLSPTGARVPVRNGPFSRRWAWLIAEIAGQFAIDEMLGPRDSRLRHVIS
ncbi:hypothetical protein [Paraburkholderia tagetis]|uniref:Uncharacterized protein n=1 Tax=Paraburkholderia tagetis TaxID=2913261 RepID=A0A9X1UNT3_9BURK|nr:hypothetical protein [Paraburkholderia tagetis]MCG5078863.1 hypothetical protein [Paraburkholderia tagetis]